MNSKQFLEQAITLEASIRSRLSEIEKFRTLAEGAGAIRYDRDNVQTQRSMNAPFESPLIMAADLEREAKEEVKELWIRLAEIRAVISGVEDLNIQNVLRMRYIAGKTVEEVAHDLKISRPTVFRRLEEGYHEVSLLTGLEEPPKHRMPARERQHKIAREMMKEVYGDEQIH